jgi:hypothetical protein
MAAYSIDLRQKILRACKRQLGSQRTIADVSGVSLAFVEKVLRQHRTTGDIATKPPRVVRSLAWTPLPRLSYGGCWVTIRMRPWRSCAQA